MKARSLQVNPHSEFDCYIIDFGNMSQEEAEEYVDCFNIVKKRVKPERMKLRDVKDNYTSKNFWWQPHKKRNELRGIISSLNNYIAVARHSKAPHFTLIDSEVIPGDGVVAIVSADIFLLGILSSKFHTIWAWMNGSTLKGDLRYTPTSILQTFPFPLNVSLNLKNEIEIIMEQILAERRRLMQIRKIGLTKLYNNNYVTLTELHKNLDKLVCECYGWSTKVVSNEQEIKERLLHLNYNFHSHKNETIGGTHR